MFKTTLLALTVLVSVCFQSFATNVQYLRSFPYDLPRQMVRGNDGNFYGYVSYDESNVDHPDDYSYWRVFQLTTAGAYRVLHFFGPIPPNYTRTIGVPGPADYPLGPLVAAPDGSVYGAVAYGGANGYGQLFRLTPDGTYTVLFEFTADQSIAPFSVTAAGEVYGLDLSATISYGANQICKLDAAGNWSVIRSFAPVTTLYEKAGQFPDAASAAIPRQVKSLLLASDGSLYGATICGGETVLSTRSRTYLSSGVLFRITPDGTFNIIKNGIFSKLAENADGTIYGYGSTPELGLSGSGEIFSYTPSQGYQSIRIFNNIKGDMAIWLLGADGNSYATVAFPWETDMYGAYGGANIASITPSGDLSVLQSFPNVFYPALGSVSQTSVDYMLDGHDGNIYLVVTDVVPVNNYPTTASAPAPARTEFVTRGTNAASKSVRYAQRKRVARVRSTNPSFKVNSIATNPDFVQLPRSRDGVATTAIIDPLRNDTIARGAVATILRVSTPQHGTVEILPGTSRLRPRIRYTATEFAPVDNFTYTVLDDSGATATTGVVVYGYDRHLLRGTVTTPVDGSKVGSVSIVTGSLSAFRGTVVYLGRAYPIAGRFDTNGRWSHSFSRNGNFLAEVQLTQEADGTISGLVVTALLRNPLRTSVVR